jgi:putative FmdB family regulatory protein
MIKLMKRNSFNITSGIIHYLPTPPIRRGRRPALRWSPVTSRAAGRDSAPPQIEDSTIRQIQVQERENPQMKPLLDGTQWKERYLAMPLYEFTCCDCEKDFELLVRSSKWEGTPCPHCGSKKLSKKLSVFAASVASSTSAVPSCAMNPQGGGGCGCCSPHHHH